MANDKVITTRIYSYNLRAFKPVFRGVDDAFGGVDDAFGGVGSRAALTMLSAALVRARRWFARGVDDAFR